MTVRDFLLPDLGEGLEDAEVVAWRVAVGDRVELNQTLAEVNTAKALVEIPSPWEGVVEHLHAGEGDVVKVGALLVSIRTHDEADGDHEAGGDDGDVTRPRRRAVLVGYGVAEEEEEETVRTAGTPSAETAGTGRAAPTPASPPVRKLARELGVDLASLAGTGPNGRVTRQDVMQAAGKPADDVEPRPGGSAEDVDDVERVAVRGTRRLIAEHMALAAREVPMVTTFLSVDASSIQAFREDIERREGERVSPLPIVVRALAEVCARHPKLNSSFDAERSEILLHRRCHVGIATDTDGGLLVPVVRDAGRRGILDIAGEIARLSEAARTGRIAAQEMSGGTITVTNVGSFGAEYGTPILNHPEAAILALGVLEPRAMVVQGRIEARPAVTLSLTFDHRVLDGAEAGRGLGDLGALLESPFMLGALPRRSAGS